IALPERSVIQFTLHGRSVGLTQLEGWDRPVGRPPLNPDLYMTISVRMHEVRRVAVCYVFDRINPDTGARGDFAGHLARANKVFLDQANFAILNIDGAAANTQSARTLTLTDKVLGKMFDLLDKKLVGRIISDLEDKFPTIFQDANTVLLAMPVPMWVKQKK